MVNHQRNDSLMKETAVEWYAKQMQLKEQFKQEEFNNIFNQAKEMEKQQIDIDKQIKAKITDKLPDGVLWEKAKEYSKQFAIRDKPVQSEIAMNEAQDHYYRGMINLRDMIEQQNNELLNVIKDCREKVDTEVPFGKEDAYDAIINEVDKHK